MVSGRGRPLAALMLLAAAFAAPAAHSHGLLKGAVPAERAGLRAAPKQVVITFSEPLEPALSRITVRDAAGKRVDKGNSSVSRGNARILTVDLEGLKPGSYTVHWAITSVDTHRTEGRYVFDVLK